EAGEAAMSLAPVRPVPKTFCPWLGLGRFVGGGSPDPAFGLGGARSLFGKSVQKGVVLLAAADRHPEATAESGSFPDVPHQDARVDQPAIGDARFRVVRPPRQDEVGLGGFDGETLLCRHFGKAFED